jgi:hypothetical protein
MQYSCSSQSTRVPSEFGIFGYLSEHLSTLSHRKHASERSYKCGAHRLPLSPLCPVGLVRAVVATEATASGVLADTTGATAAALLTTGTTDTALTAAAFVATAATAGTALDTTDETTGTAGTADVTADDGMIAGVETTAGTSAAEGFGSSAPTVPTRGGT